MVTDRDLLINTYNKFNARDIDAILAQMHPDVDWPNGWEGGRVYGREGIRDYWTRQWKALDPHVEPVGFDTDETGRTVVKVHQVVRDLSGNVISDGMVEHVYLIEDGLIKSMDTGTVEIGKLADLVLLEADPLVDIHNTRRIHAVILRGELLDGPALQTLLNSTQSHR